MQSKQKQQPNFFSEISETLSNPLLNGHLRSVIVLSVVAIGLEKQEILAMPPGQERTDRMQKLKSKYRKFQEIIRDFNQKATAQKGVVTSCQRIEQ